MDQSQITSDLKVFFEREFPNPGVALTETTSLLEDWFVDSLAIVTTTLFLESHFGIELQRADINGENFRDIASLARLVAGRLEKR
jgi:acyl carrier protein